MTILNLICLLAFMGDLPPQTSIRHYGEGGKHLPTFLGSTPGPEFFDNDLDGQAIAESDYHLILELRNLEEVAAIHGKKRIHENLRIVNPNDQNIDVVITAKNADQFEHFLVRVGANYMADLDIRALAAYTHLQLASLMPFAAELQHFDAQANKKLENQMRKAEAPLNLSDYLEERRATDQAISSKAIASDSRFNLSLRCAPDPSVEHCSFDWDYGFADCPANPFCTTNTITRWVQINGGDTVARVERRYVGTSRIGGRSDLECNGDPLVPTWEANDYWLDWYWPLSGSTPTLTGRGGGNSPQDLMYPCLRKTYVVTAQDGRDYNVRGVNGEENADEVLLGEAWGYNPEGQIICTVRNGCSTTSDFVAWRYRTLSAASVDDISLNWGKVELGQAQTQSITVTARHIPYSGTLTISGDSDFRFNTGASKSISLAAGQSQTITITFSPNSVGKKFATINIPDVDQVYLNGEGYEAAPPEPSPLRAWPSGGHNFGFQPLNSSENYAFVVTNDDEQNALTANVSVSGSNMFSLIQGEGNYTFSPGQSKTFTIKYNPTAIGSFQAQLNFDVAGYSPLSLSLSGNVNTGGPAELAVTSVSTPGQTYAAGDSFDVSYTVANNGGQPARYWRDQLWLSSNGSLQGATLLWESSSYNFDFNPGSVLGRTINITLPSNLTAGNYQIIAFTDSANIIQESNESDNTGSTTIQVTANAPDKDLIIDGSITASSTAVGSRRVYIQYDLSNQGTFAVTENTREKILISSKPYYDSNYIHQTYYTQTHTTDIAAGGSVRISTVMYLQSYVPTGTFYLLIYADGDDTCIETDETNNMTVKQVYLR